MKADFTLDEWDIKLIKTFNIVKTCRHSPWQRGYSYIIRMGKLSQYPYSVKECRIAAMSFEAGWKAAKRHMRKPDNKI